MRSWKELLDLLSPRRLTARIALSASLLGLAAPDTSAATQPRVPVTPALEPEATVRKFKGRYLLRRAANSFVVHLAGHRSHSSHSSHRSHSSHSSHSSSSHYSGAHFSHYSSSAPAPRPVPAEPAPTRAPKPPTPVAPAKPQPLLDERFNDQPPADRWRIGVLATPPSTFDSAIDTVQASRLTITPRTQIEGDHFNGYVSVETFNLALANISVEVPHAAGGGATTLVAAALDDRSWYGFRIEAGELWLESHVDGKVARRTIRHEADRHRFLRLRVATVANVVAWETSGDGRSWTPQYVEPPRININTLRIALSAGTTKPIANPGSAVFDNLRVEVKP